MLSERDLQRYERQIRIFGKEGQEKLKKAKVFIGGAGGLGSSISLYLAAAGVGRIRIVDHGTIELSNLNRQLLYADDDLGKGKSDCARERLKRLNPSIEVETFSETIAEENVNKLVADSDLIVDALDNFPTRYLLNTAAQVKNIPLFHGAVERLYGQATTIIPGQTACLRCIFPNAPAPSAVPVVGSFCGVIGCIQATEVIKYINATGKLLKNKLLMVDGLNSTLEEIEVQRNPGCEDCRRREIAS
jgi:adenylyltransferase/sulfurtransferase